MIPELLGSPPTLYESIPGTFAEMRHLFLQCLEQEFGRIGSIETMDKISQGLSSIRMSYKLHTLFSESVVRHVTDTVFGNREMAEFILSLTDNFYINLSNQETVDRLIGALSMLAHTTADGILGESAARLMMDVSKVKDRGQVVKHLESASWLVTVVMIVLTSRSALNVVFMNKEIQERTGPGFITDPVTAAANYMARDKAKN